MAQHFLLSPAARDMSALDVARMREATAYKLFRLARWPETDGKPYCPDCGNLRCYEMSRTRFECSERQCRKVFTVTSGTVFASRKLPFKKMVFAIWLSANSVKGKAARHRQISLTCTY